MITKIECWPVFKQGPKYQLMNPSSSKSMFSTGHLMSQCQQNPVMCSVCN